MKNNNHEINELKEFMNDQDLYKIFRRHINLTIAQAAVKDIDRNETLKFIKRYLDYTMSNLSLDIEESIKYLYGE